LSFSTVRVAGVTKRFERTVALRGVDLTLDAGTCTLLLGSNGAGKTTLLGIISTRQRPTRGEVLYGDRRWEQVDGSIRARIGLVPHGSLLYGDLSAWENLLFYARLHGLLDPASRIRQVLAEVGMLEEADRLVRTCSRGMLQRLSLARALLHDPALLLLDEPFTGLDGEATERLLAALASYRAKGRILLVVTHHPAPLAPLCDQAVLLERGKVLRQAVRSRDEVQLLAMLRSGREC